MDPNGCLAAGLRWKLQTGTLLTLKMTMPGGTISLDMRAVRTQTAGDGHHSGSDADDSTQESVEYTIAWHVQVDTR